MPEEKKKEKVEKDPYQEVLDMLNEYDEGTPARDSKFDDGGED